MLIKEIPNYSRYTISERGSILDTWKHTFVHTYQTKEGYIKVQLQATNGEWHDFFVHRLLMTTFRPIVHPEQYHIHHKDGIKYHNFLNNLVWLTPSNHNKLHNIKVYN